ncbi:MAG: flagellar assembly protein FliW [Candidatus Binatia bacterium]
MIVSVRKRRAPSRANRTLEPQSRQSASPQPLAPLPVEGLVEVVFPDGLFGLPECRRFVLTKYQPEDGSASPFFLLQCQDENLSLPVLDPRWVVPDYHFSIAPDVLVYLQANAVEELSTLAIVTVRDRVEDITLNLQGPLVVNFTAQRGLQMVVEHFPVRYPLFVQTDEPRVATK